MGLVTASVTVRFVVAVPVSEAEAHAVADGRSEPIEDDVVRRGRLLVAAGDPSVEEDIAGIKSEDGTEL